MDKDRLPLRLVEGGVAVWIADAKGLPIASGMTKEDGFWLVRACNYFYEWDAEIPGKDGD